MWLLPLHRIRNFFASLNTSLTATNNDNARSLGGGEMNEKKKVYKFVQTVSYLLIGYSTDNAITKAALAIELFNEQNIETIVQFPEVWVVWIWGAEKTFPATRPGLL